MSLILVVDPDSRHAAQVASMARKHLKAEFVTADSGFRALEVLADRVPDIVLTAPLLPTRDEAVLSDYLRALGDAGAHVQTLTIPILSAAAAPPRGVRGRFRRDRPAPPADGCDPELFAQQVNQYLQRAQQSRRVSEDEAGGAGRAGEAGQEAVRRPGAAEGLAIEAVRRPGAAEGLAIEAVRRPGAAEYVSIEADPAGATDSADPADIDLTPFLAAIAEHESPLAMPAPAPVYAPAQPLPAITALPPVMLARALAPPPARVIEAELVDAQPPVRRADSAEGRSIRGGSAEREPADPAPSTQHLITLPAGLGDHGAPATVNVAVAVSVQVATQSVRRSAKRATPKPIQDEWGFFDPDQCGFKALLARLDTIAEENGD